MNIVLPINVAALRVSPSTAQTGKTALYDFGNLGVSPLSSGGNLIAAEQFKYAEEELNREPGIHLHWSLPKAYTRGAQDNNDGSLGFPTLPNRWLVIRIFQYNGTPPKGVPPTNVTAWILESDAHVAPANKNLLNNTVTTMPWMDNETDLTGLDYHFVAQQIMLDGSWTEPNGGNSAVSYLGSYLQAPLAYGQTFTAYYRHSTNLFGMFDDLLDLFGNSNALEENCTFSVSYAVIGWVSPQANDVAVEVLTQAVQDYENLPPNNRPDFPTYAQGVIEGQLKWSLDDYSGFTVANAPLAQGVLSGIVSDVTWNITSPGNPTYPDPVPSAAGIDAAVGNNAPEALSAYLATVENSQWTDDPGSVTANLEWLLNAFQYGQLGSLGDGEVGAGQLDEYLHSRSFGSRAGGTIWSVREPMTPGSKATPREPIEVTLPISLAKLLSLLNGIQRQYDAFSDDIFTRQQKLFQDWCYHIQSIDQNVILGGQNIDIDTSGTYLTTGLISLFPLFTATGSQALPAQIGPPSDLVAPFSINVENTFVPNLAGYQFAQTANSGAASLVTSLLDLAMAVESDIPAGLDDLSSALMTARAALISNLAGGTTAPSYLSQAIASIQEALATSAVIGGSWAATAAEFATIESGQITPAAAALATYTASEGVFPQFLAVTPDSPIDPSNPVPTPPGQVYAGSMASNAEFVNAAQWTAHAGFPGMSDLMDRLSGQGAYTPNVFDTRTAAVYIGTAYFWRLSGQQSRKSVPYFIQMAKVEIAAAQADAAAAGTALQAATVAVTTGGPLSPFDPSIQYIATVSLPTILDLLTGASPQPYLALLQIDGLVGTENLPGGLWPVPTLQTSLQGSDGKTLVGNIEIAAQSVLNRLPLSQQAALLGDRLSERIQQFELWHLPDVAFWQPNEPVLLLAEDQGGLIGPVDRNGAATLLPCRLDTEVVTGSATFPPVIATLSTSVNPGIPGLSTVFQGLAEEAWLLSPEQQTLVTPAVLEAAAAQEVAQQGGITGRVALIPPPKPLSGLLPYTIAWNWSSGDPFLPLYVYWQAEYVYSQRFSSTGSLPPNLLAEFAWDDYEVGYQPLAASLPDFQKNNGTPNFETIYGVVSLSSATTANLCDQIRAYCIGQFGYDPSQGPPGSGPNQQEEQLFYEAYSGYLTRNVLSQGMSGFNPAMIQRVEELQLPLNIPASWVSATGNNIPISAFWATQFLLNQSTGWPTGWSGEAMAFGKVPPNAPAFAYNPLRAGFMQVTGLTLVDAFGRFVDLPEPLSLSISENLQSVAGAPVGDPVYLPPRLVQPARLLGRWLSADAPDSLGDFTEWNPHPAASPICGWLFPDHLDGSLAVYNADGAPLGSLGEFEQVLRWFVVPGESYTEGIDNRTLMLDDLANRNANPAMQGFLASFAYADETAPTFANFEQFLQVIDQAQQFIITKSMQEDQALAVLIGQPLALARATVRLELKGVPNVGLDVNFQGGAGNYTYSPWNGSSPQFQMDNNGYVDYNFANYNEAGILGLQVPVRVGAVEYNKDGMTVPFFDDGVVGFFLNDDYGTLYTPVTTAAGVRIQSTSAPGSHPLVVLPDGDAVTITLLIDPRASVHLNSAILPVAKLNIPPDQYASALNRLQMTFLTAPIFRNDKGVDLAVPSETGYAWSWWQIGQPGDEPVTASQLNSDARFSTTTPSIVDGWLKLKKDSSP